MVSRTLTLVRGLTTSSLSPERERLARGVVAAVHQHLSGVLEEVPLELLRHVASLIEWLPRRPGMAFCTTTT